MGDFEAYFFAVAAAFVYDLVTHVHVYINTSLKDRQFSAVVVGQLP